MSKQKTIYDLELNENIVVNGHTVHRVPGGWVYTREEPQVNILSTCFVPYSNEFREPIKLDTHKYSKRDIIHVLVGISDWIEKLECNTRSENVLAKYVVANVGETEALEQFKKALYILNKNTK